MQPDQFKSLHDLLDYFTSEEVCLDYLSSQRWQDGVICPHCSNDKIYTLKGANKRFKCSKCRKQFTARAGTIFEDSKISLRKWFSALYLLLSHKKGISSYQLARDLGVTQKTAWFMGMRIRNAVKQGNFEKPITVAEVDETFVGGKNRNRHHDKKAAVIPYGRNFTDKVPVMGILDRDTRTIRCFIVPNTAKASLHPILKSNVEEGAILISDEWKGYKGLTEYFQHEVVDHSRKQYLNDAGATTNGIENVWSHFKRAWGTTYCGRISRFHLPRYTHEFVFRFNTRHLQDGHRALTILAMNEGSIKYKQLIHEKESKKGN